MAAVDILAGDFPQGRAEFGFGLLVFPKKPKQGFPHDISLKPEEDLEHVEIVTLEEADKLAKAAGTSLAAGLMFGPAGFVIGGLLGASGKKKKTITFKATFSSSRSMLASTDEKTFAKLQALAFGRKAALAVESPDTESVTTDDTLSKLERLASLKERGLLSDDEFQQEKAKLLG
ncbi:hypothetical protein WS72_13445 [Burkholderia savannae]|uniref:SHOCT domain-containing protein n=1 Tax=Burkholderia savannae TaxID=1637837 RepID=A0ABR5TFI4_9BURK|nr:SHOCT domain-containing protein [Burkholderia savannae]KWZ43761.1 hypothetical protein WS72_13445 [Burkholderia savannae]